MTTLFKFLLINSVVALVYVAAEGAVVRTAAAPRNEPHLAAEMVESVVQEYGLPAFHKTIHAFAEAGRAMVGSYLGSSEFHVTFSIALTANCARLIEGPQAQQRIFKLAAVQFEFFTDKDAKR